MVGSVGQAGARDGSGNAVVRPERPADVAAIRSVNEACFPTPAEARLVDLLRDAGNLAVSLVDEEDGRIVGHVAFSRVTVASGATGLGLAPVAVLASHRHRGVATELIEEGLREARRKGFGWVVVLGAPGFYARFGFRAAREVGLVDEYGGGDAFQALELVPGALPRGAGLVRYAPEFEQLEKDPTRL